VKLAVACLLAAALAAGCGSTSEVREPDLVIRGASPRPADTGEGSEDQRITIAVVTHGQASSAFWSIVRNGIEAGSRQMDVQVNYRAPDVYDVDTMSDLIDAAVATEPDGLVVSIPSEAIAPAIRRAVAAGIPVVSINSGSEVAGRIGTLAHVGQPEAVAGVKAGRRLAATGARNALCVNQEPGNDGLDRRCAGFSRAMGEAGGRARVLAVDDKDVPQTRRRLATASAADGVDAVLTLNNTVAEIATEVAPRRVRLATFDYSPKVLEALRSGRIRFAVDQQPYLQGYLPIVFLAERERYGLFPAQGEVIPTGPNFVTRETAAQAARLSQLGIR
jgi:simple sugar transport system substrate-binding protein